MEFGLAGELVFDVFRHMASGQTAGGHGQTRARTAAIVVRGAEQAAVFDAADMQTVDELEVHIQHAAELIGAGSAERVERARIVLECVVLRGFILDRLQELSRLKSSVS